MENFRGKVCVRGCLERIITDCTLLSGMGYFGSKMSFRISLANNISVFCQIAGFNFSFGYKDKLNDYNGTVTELFNENSRPSITKVTLQTGLHNGTVEAYIDSTGMLFVHFTVQSEQLPSHFITAGKYFTSGLLMQTLPFADEKAMGKHDRELHYLAGEQEEVS